MIAADLAKNRNVAGDRRDAVMRRLDQRHAKSLHEGRKNKRARMAIKQLQIVVAGVGEPEQTPAVFLMTTQFFLQDAGFPSRTTDNHISRIGSLGPELFERRQRHRIGLARFNRADAEEKRRSIRDERQGLSRWR